MTALDSSHSKDTRSLIPLVSGGSPDYQDHSHYYALTRSTSSHVCPSYEACSAPRAIRSSEAGDSSVVLGASAPGEAAASAFSFSSTPCPRQRGHELRPCVSHYESISKQKSIVVQPIATHLINTLLVIEVGAFDKLPRKFLGLEFT